ncbi:DUF2383 domain-containing protein [Jannaschia sp. LMIT008]|uniref:DUF2383 domain-containing protein n=1 Tax=Jannaschia maritima TaxID=3032585 RepID=UPI002810DA0F|nr:DUF2383 domain-containing protein [Jannaschia sp. LMIT008]
MATPAVSALHSVNSAINDVLSGYETLKDRAQSEILGIARDLDALHRQHAAAIQARLAAHGEATDDGSVRGTVNKAATTLRDWVGSLDADALSFVRMGEEMLLGVYDSALKNWDAADGPEDRALVAEQHAELDARVKALPKS